MCVMSGQSLFQTCFVEANEVRLCEGCTADISTTPFSLLATPWTLPHVPHQPLACFCCCPTRCCIPKNNSPFCFNDLSPRFSGTIHSDQSATLKYRRNILTIMNTRYNCFQLPDLELSANFHWHII